MTINLQQQAFHAILNASHMARDLYPKAAANEGLNLTFSQLAILLSLSEKPILLRECSERSGVDRSTTSSIVWRLYAKKLVTICNEVDGVGIRDCYVSIADSGVRLRERAENILTRLDKAYLEEVGDEAAQALFMSQLDKIIAAHQGASPV